MLESVPSSGIAAKRERADWVPTPFVCTSKVVAESRVGDFLAKDSSELVSFSIWF